MSFITQKVLICNFCHRKESTVDKNFPEDLHALLSKYHIPQILWMCESCEQTQNLKFDFSHRLNLEDDVLQLKTKVQELESNMNDLRNLVEGSGPGIYESWSEIKDDFQCSSRIKCDAERGYRKVDVCPSSPGEYRRSRSGSPHSCSSFTSDDTTPKKNKEVNAILDAKIKKEINIDAQEFTKSSNLVAAFMNCITPALKKDPVFSCLYQRDYKTGSFYNQLRISDAAEFDINIVFKPPSQIALEVEFLDDTFVFAKIKWSKVDELHENKLIILNFFEKNSENGYLKPEKVKSWFQGLVDVFLSSIDKHKVTGVKQIRNSQSGPARTIELVTDEDYVLNIDLMPVFEFPYDVLTKTPINKIFEKYPVHKSKEFWHLVPKLCRGEQEMSISDCKFTWRVNFPEIEKKVLYDKQCAKNVIKLLKLLRDKQNWKTIASYHMNTVILLEVDKSSEPAYWKQGKFLFVRFLEALKQLQGYLRENHLPYFFCAEYNLFHVLNSGTCKNISDRLGRIISSIEADPSNLKLYL